MWSYTKLQQDISNAAISLTCIVGPLAHGQLVQSQRVTSVRRFHYTSCGWEGPGQLAIHTMPCKVTCRNQMSAVTIKKNS